MTQQEDAEKVLLTFGVLFVGVTLGVVTVLVAQFMEEYNRLQEERFQRRKQEALGEPVMCQELAPDVVWGKRLVRWPRVSGDAVFEYGEHYAYEGGYGVLFHEDAKGLVWGRPDGGDLTNDELQQVSRALQHVRQILGEGFCTPNPIPPCFAELLEEEKVPFCKVVGG